VLQVSSPFWNYFSFGIDAEAAWGFAHLRELKPHLAKKRAANMAWYAWYSCGTGWFCPGQYALQNRIHVTLKVSARPHVRG
jgi:diacylglycerol kinase (ATP)